MLLPAPEQCFCPEQWFCPVWCFCHVLMQDEVRYDYMDDEGEAPPDSAGEGGAGAGQAKAGAASPWLPAMPGWVCAVLRAKRRYGRE